MSQIAPKKQFDSTYPSGDAAFTADNFRRNFQALYGGDFLPMRPLAHDVPDMRVMVLGSDAVGYQQGVYYGDNSQRIALESGDSPVMTAPVGGNRIDVLYMTPSGDLMVKAGTVAANPVIPSISESGDRIPIAAVYHRATSTKIVNYVDKDSYTGDSYLYADLRPLYVVPRQSVDDVLGDEIDRNTKNIMLNRLNIMQQGNLTIGKMIDGWADDFQDSVGIASSAISSGDLIAAGDHLRYSRNYAYQGTPNFNVVRSISAGGTVYDVPIDSYDKLFCEMNGTTTTFVDSSTANPKTITANGGATQLPYKLNKSAGFFDGASYIGIPTSADFDFGAGDFTVEGWLWWEDTADTYRVFFDSGTNASKGFDIRFLPNASNAALIYMNGGNVATFSTINMTIRAWNHVALTRSTSDGKLHLWINGVQNGTGVSNSTNLTANAGCALGIDIGGTYYWKGWMKEVRVSNTARYSTNFTPSTTQFMSDANTKLLMHFDTPATSPLGPAIYFDGTGDYLTLADSDDWDFGTGNFTIEFWANLASVTTQQCILSRTYASSLLNVVNQSDEIVVEIAGTGFSFYPVSTQITRANNVWYHYAITRSGTELKLFINGVQIDDTKTFSGNITGTDGLYIGQTSSGLMPLTGYLREFRLSNVARYTSAFTPSQSGFTVDANTKLYIKGDENNGVTTFVDSETVPKTVTTAGDTKIKYTEDYRSRIFKDETGKFPYPQGSAKVDFFAAFGESVADLRTAGSYLSVPDGADFQFGTGDLTIEYFMRRSSVAAAHDIITKLTSTSYEIYENGTTWSFYGAGGTPSVTLPAESQNLNTWQHYMVTRSGNLMYFFYNGTLVGSAQNVAGVSYDGQSAAFQVGHYNGAGGGGPQALMDNVRISKGVARYVATFNPPGVTSSPANPGGAGGDGKAIVVTVPQGFDFLATKAAVVLVSKVAQNISAEISRNSGDSWNAITLETDFYDGTYYYRSGINEALTGAGSGASGDYLMTFIIPSGDNSTLEAYAVSLA